MVTSVAAKHGFALKILRVDPVLVAHHAKERLEDEAVNEAINESKPVKTKTLKDKIKPSNTPKEPEIGTAPNNKSREIKKLDLIKKEERENEDQEPKKKKERTQNQINATNKMRETLKARREANLKIKETVKLEHEELNKKIKKKLHKTRINEEVQKKLKEIIESESDESEETESSVEEAEEVVINKKKPSRNYNTRPPLYKIPERPPNPFQSNLKVNFF